jgi:hypothetical protein
MKTIRNILIIFFFLVGIGVFGFANNIYAANCGDTTGASSTRVACSCGDTVTTDYTLDSTFNGASLSCTTSAILTVYANLTLAADITTTGHGFVVGASGADASHPIVINGNSHTITGDGGASDYGVNNSGSYNNITVENFLNISNFGTGVYTKGSSNTISNNIIHSTSMGIQVIGTSGTHTTGNNLNYNTISGNSNNGINVTYSNNIIIDHNTANSGSTGINVISSSNSPTLTYNTTNYNLNNGINIGDIIGTIASPTLLSYNTAIQNNANGINIIRATTPVLDHNVVSSNPVGIFLTTAVSTLTNNTFNSNTTAITFVTSASSSLTGNYFVKNRQDIIGGVTNTYTSNQMVGNFYNKMLSFAETSTAGIKTVGVDAVNFTVTAKTMGSASCTGCSTNITVYPSEASLSYADNSGTVTGTFTPTKSGTYSLLVSVSDASSNVTTEKFSFFAGVITNTSSTYYYRGGTTGINSPTHGQPYGTGNDTKILSTTVASSTEEEFCAQFIQNTPDQIPSFPLVNISAINTNSWYYDTTVKDGSYPVIKVQRFVNYYGTVAPPLVDFDQKQSVTSSSSYLWSGDQFGTDGISFTNINWSMDYPYSWYWVALKLDAGSSGTTHNVGQTSFTAGQSANPSFAKFTYQYTTTPVVQSMSNENISVLSATSPATGDTSNATLVLDGTIDSTLSGTGSTNIVLGDPANSHSFRRPFQGYTTTINSDGTATLLATGITGVTTINSVPLDITPASGSITTNITTWNTSGDYSKQWTETGVGVASAVHTVGNLKPNTFYSIKSDGVELAIYYSDANGNITFTYSKGYSTHTFNVAEAPSAPGGGGGSYIPTGTTITTPPPQPLVTTLPPITSPTATDQQILDAQKIIAQLTQQIQDILNKKTPSPTPTSAPFNKNLYLGDRSPDVKRLQQYLNSNGFIVSPTGPGSPGKETIFFGYGMKAALIKFQEAHSDQILKPWFAKGTGIFGPMTRNFINSGGK